ncbi:glycosyltransferase family 2 protein [Glaciecola sp. 1036]|uniref:glycosyltransferase family 2 protein n=1 Tax=Alteromonadaceae TaxID=72275 RepID=UPI003D08E255
MKPRILLAGIAKNEAAYLPEWIFHHLSLGIDEILVYINNTTDNSQTVLDKLGKTLPVKYEVVDGIDKVENDYFNQHIGARHIKLAALQSKSYARIYQTTDPEKFDYILYLDIDEFLCVKSPIEDFYQSLSNANVSSFQWFSLTGDEKEFSTFTENLCGEYDYFNKYLVKTGCENIVIETNHEAWVDDAPPKLNPHALVAHRVLRSQKEYLALLLRSNPDEKNLSNGFKFNRRGWTSKANDALPQEYQACFELHKESFDDFCKRLEIQEDLEVARELVLERAEMVKTIVNDLNISNSELGRVLAGTGLSHFSFFSWLKKSSKDRLIVLLFPSLKIRHIPVLDYVKLKLSEMFNKKSKH